jgi:hypothetical protein
VAMSGAVMEWIDALRRLHEFTLSSIGPRGK